MKWLRLSAVAAICISVPSLLAGGQARPGQLTPQEKRGKQIYLRGASPAGREITAALADGAVEMAASALTCASCHGYDGQGRPEGGAVPSNITWEALTKPYGVTHAGGRKHAPYDERSVALSISAGIDPAGNKLSGPMPLYRLSREDMADLIAYLKRLGEDLDPGLADTTIALGTILPSQGPFAKVGEAVRAALEACLAEINAQGGIYNRRLELRIADYGSSAANTKASLEQFLQKEQVFAMLGAFVAGADKEVATLMDSQEMPLVGPLTLFPQAGFPLNRYVFYLQPGVRDQARALVTFAKMKLGLEAPRVAVVYPRSELAEDAVEGVEEQVKSVGWGPVTKIRLDPRANPAGLVAELIEKQTDALFLLSSGNAEISLLREGQGKHWAPRVFIPSPAASRGMLELLAGFKGRAYLSFPIASEQNMPAIMAFRALAAKYKLPPQHIPAQISAYCAVRVLIEGLKRAGRDLSRERLITALEGLYEFDTGLIPPVSYGPNRRIGVLGAYIVAFDPEKKELTPAGEWVKLN